MKTLMNLAAQYHNKVKKIFSPSTPDDVAENLARGIIAKNENGDDVTLWDAMSKGISLVRHCPHEHIIGDSCADCGMNFS